jgi:hypothetical protein
MRCGPLRRPLGRLGANGALEPEVTLVGWRTALTRVHGADYLGRLVCAKKVSAERRLLYQRTCWLPPLL